MDYELRKTCRFEAAHHIPNHKGACRNPHGHSYVVDFVIKADRLNADGFVVDFGDLSALCKEFDHKDLNEIPPFNSSSGYPTTAENIASFLASRVLGLGDNLLAVTVTVHETAGASVSVTLKRDQ